MEDTSPVTCLLGLFETEILGFETKWAVVIIETSLGKENLDSN